MFRTITLSFIIFIQSLLINCNAQQAEIPTVRQQLEELNEFWKEKPDFTSELSEQLAVQDEVALIQMHFDLLIPYLRQHTPEGLNGQQLYKRNSTLDILEEYQDRGVFPVNLYHQQRRPYFIDHKGTACAVGHLIIETGHREVAEMIADKDNYGYLMEMCFPEVGEWATNYGFMPEELAWIQPSYGPVICPCPAGSDVLDCNGDTDGCIDYNALIAGLTPPITSTGTFCNLPAGNYSEMVTDSGGTMVVFNFTISEPPALTMNETVINAKCYGEASGELHVVPSGGVPPYFLAPQTGGLGFADSLVTGLAAGLHTVLLVDNNGCTSSITFTITEPADSLSVSFVVDSTDFAGATGSITETVAGGTPPYECGWSNGAIGLEATQLPAGTYSVTINDANGCELIVSGIEVFEREGDTTTNPIDTTLAIESIDFTAANIVLGPVPAADVLNITIPINWEGAQLSLVDLTGREVKQMQASKEQLQLDITPLQKGYYLLVFRKDLAVTTTAIIIE